MAAVEAGMMVVVQEGFQICRDGLPIKRFREKCGDAIRGGAGLDGLIPKIAAHHDDTSMRGRGSERG